MSVPAKTFSRESYFAPAIVALGSAIIVVIVAGGFHVGVYGCPTCTFSDNGLDTHCDYTPTTYCGGGLPALGVTIFLLSGLSLLYGLCWMAATQRPETGPGRATSVEPSPGRKLLSRVASLTLLADGVCLVSLGLWTTPNFCLPIQGLCYTPAYVLTGVPLDLVILGWIVYATGAALFIHGLLGAFRERHVKAPAT